jgi:hypothetical protein
MFNFIIVLVLMYAVFSGTRASDYRLGPGEIPWWFLVIAGFTVSLLGLFKYNDERIIFAGCGVLLIAKVLFYRENRNADPEPAPSRER